MCGCPHIMSRMRGVSPRSLSIPVSSRIFPRTTFSPGKGDPANTPIAHTGSMSMLSCHARGVHSCGVTPPCSQPVSTLTCTSTLTNASLLHPPRISALSQLHAPDASGMVAATPKHTVQYHFVAGRATMSGVRDRIPHFRTRLALSVVYRSFSLAAPADAKHVKVNAQVPKV
jgi:hypothetical protein